MPSPSSLCTNLTVLRWCDRESLWHRQPEFGSPSSPWSFIPQMLSSRCQVLFQGRHGCAAVRVAGSPCPHGGCLLVSKLIHHLKSCYLGAMKGDREQVDEEASSRKDLEEPGVMGRSGCLEMWGKGLPGQGASQ